MANRSIIKLPNSRASIRPTGRSFNVPKPKGPGSEIQGQRFASTFEKLTETLSKAKPHLALKQDPFGIAPDRALVFKTAGSIQNFITAAEKVGLTVISEIEDDIDIPDGFTSPGQDGRFSPILYATMPTLSSIKEMLSLWSAHQNGEAFIKGKTPWKHLFDLLIELRVWGPEDRLPLSSRKMIEENLPFDDEDPVKLELEIFPVKNKEKRDIWLEQARKRVSSLNGTIVDTCSIVNDGFIYEALLVQLSTSAVRHMLENISDINGLAMVDGIQLILPQSVAQAPYPKDNDDHDTIGIVGLEVDLGLPLRCALFDGTVAASHPSLIGGVAIEDINDLVRLSVVSNRDHATSMASLILRGDLSADGEPLNDSRILNVPVLVDLEQNTVSPDNRLFIDLINTTLTRLFSSEISEDHDIFVINFSIGISNLRYSGQISALARLLDWWSYTHGILFVISAGNINDDLIIPNMSIHEFESLDEEDRSRVVREAVENSAFNRTLLSPAESLNGLTVGALSEDLSVISSASTNAFTFIGSDGPVTAISSALGLGAYRTIKPDVVTTGGLHEYSVYSDSRGVRLILRMSSPINGLLAASPRNLIDVGMCRTRGTSCAAALTTRAVLQAASELVSEGGPFQGEELSRQDNALLTRALAINSAIWSNDAIFMYDEVASKLDIHWFRAKEHVAKFYGYGFLAPQMMKECASHNAILVGLETINKNEARIFDVPLPQSLSGEKIGRWLRITIAWFSPINPIGARYKMATLEATCGDELESEDGEWGLGLKSQLITENIFKRGSVWSKRLQHKRLTTPSFDENRSIPIRVHCRDTSNGNLDPYLDIRFAIVISLEVENSAQFDIHDEIMQQVKVRAQQDN